MNEFEMEKGLKQGDRLAFFLFLIVSEGLLGLARQVERKNFLDGIKVGKNDTSISMFQFTNDTMFFFVKIT